MSVAGVTRAVADSSSAPAAKPKPKASSTSTFSAAAAMGSGYWLVGNDGNVYPFGVPSHGSLGSTPPARPIVGAAAVPGGSGYWLVGTDGGIFAFGAARFFGSTGAIKLNKPIVGMAVTPSGNGYWLVASDGGIFAFGDARFFGSTGAMRLNKPVVGMASTPSGHGYWLVASDGGIFAFGDAAFFGSTGNIILNKPINGMSASLSGRGYRFVASDGGLFSFGDAPYAGSAAGKRLRDPIVGMAGSPTGNGYWLVGARGTVHSFGDVTNKGGTGNTPIPAPIVAIIAPPQPTQAPAPAAPTAGPAKPATPTAPADAPAPNGAFAVALIGDTGYSSDQDRLLLKTRTAISSLPYALVVHDGDIQHPSDPCSDERLQYVHEVFNGFTAPFVYTPGDNEWADCSDPGERLDAIRRTFFASDRSLGQQQISVTRQEGFVENARWSIGNVVFATVNVPGPSGSSSGARGLERAGVAWVNAAFDTAAAQDSPAVMIIWQDDPFDGSSTEAEEALVTRAKQFGRPVVLAHGDTHTYRLERAWREAPNMIEIQTFALEDTDRWVQVVVDPASPAVFSFENKRS
jgi:hypothetical protein